MAFVLAVIAADLAAIGVAVSSTAVTGSNLALFGLLVGCTAAAVELTRKSGEQGGMIKDVAGVWELPAAILLPPLYALIVPIIRIALLQLRTRRAPVYRRVFSGAMLSLSYGAASVTFHGLSGLIPQEAGGTLSRGTVWTLVVVVSVLMKEIVNKTVLMTVVKATDPGATYRTEVFSRERLYNDGAEICTGVLVTYGVAGNPWLALAALPVVTLLQRSLRHVQLLNDSRADSKTGLLNAATWEREATVEVTRAVRTRTPLAIAVLDIDRFKVINDTYGHLVGDQVLKELARSLDSVLRDYDRAGRFGGEEFSLLLPQTRAVDAFRIAERVRASIADLSIIVPGATGGERVHVTVSIGVAALDSGCKREYSELMAAADAALYRAKSGGRDQVQMISTTRGLSATSGTDDRADGSGKGSRTEAPSVFRRAQISLSGGPPAGPDRTLAEASAQLQLVNAWSAAWVSSR
ncbi:MAG TPA: GGDEF domain-containing protein [Streptosporangiaceae bacterium]|nr:GGDEF domain-containing protein [Streptosporangiaceae bacterium]